MRKSSSLLLSLSLTMTGPVAQATIYGENSLHEIQAHADPKVREAGRSVAVEILNNSIPSSNIDGWTKISTSTPERRGICEGEPFLKQPVASVCTGFLIAPDLILTAGHCMGGGLSCSTAKWVFDYRLPESNPSQILVPSSSIYSCTKIVSASYANRLDYAIIKLDRPVLDRKPLTLNTSPDIPQGLEVMAITAPYGMALKTSTGSVREAPTLNYVTTNVDAMRGSSGGPIFRADTMEVIGLVAQGEEDLEAGPDFNLVCNVFKRCSNNDCRGEDATRLSKIPNLDLLTRATQAR